MDQYNNYNNAQRIRKVQRKLDRRTRCLFKIRSRIARAQAELDTAKLFESCQIFKAFHIFAPNRYVMFSDANRVMWFFDHVIRYEDIESYSIVEKFVSKSRTTGSASDTISRIIVGHAFGGGLGALLGAMSADADSETIYYQKGQNFLFQIFTKDGLRHYCEPQNIGFFTNKIHPKWVELGMKIQSIIDSNN